MFCDYKTIFGTPRQGIHALRIPGLDIAFWDTVFTVVVAVLIASRSRHFGKSFIVSFSVLIAIAELLHWLFCIRNI